MPTVYCPACGQRVETAATGPGQPARCPNCGAPVAPRPAPVEAEALAADEGITSEPVAERRPLARDRHWDEDEGPRRRPRPRVRRAKRGGHRFLNATTFGAALGLLGTASAWVIFIVVSAPGRKTNDALAAALVGAGC